MQPTDEQAEILLCIRENTPVSRRVPRCLHPSSFCSFREFCEVLGRQRELRRGPAEEGRA
jgi:hypothetical protein